MLPSADAQSFLWATGIEDSFVAHARGRYRALDEYELMGHYEHWREDLALVPKIGARAVRWGVPWHRIEAERGVFDWSWVDQVIPYLVEELGILPIIDLVHYGCPLWLPRAFADPDYPFLIEAFARSFAERYSRYVHWYTPLNEPHMTAWMCGHLGVWPPYARGERGYLNVMIAAARGQVRTMAAIRQVDPGAVFVPVEAAAVFRSAVPELDELAREEQSRRFLGYDLLSGRVVPGHPLYTWLIRAGIRPGLLAEIAQGRVEFDVMGLNFYPQWSTHQAYTTRRGRVSFRSAEVEGSGFSELIETYYHRYRVPIMVTETSAQGPDEIRAAWLDASLGAIHVLRRRGIPVIGYTWFPLFTMIDWRYRYGTAPASAYQIDLGLFRLGSGSARWIATPLAERYRAYAASSSQEIAPFLAASGGERAAGQ